MDHDMDLGCCFIVHIGLIWMDRGEILMVLFVNLDYP